MTCDHLPDELTGFLVAALCTISRALASATLNVVGALPVRFSFAGTGLICTITLDLQRGGFVSSNSMCDGPDGVSALPGPVHEQIDDCAPAAVCNSIVPESCTT